MKIAVTYENGDIFQHFGHTEQFKIYETADGEVLNSVVVSTMGSGHGALAGFLQEHGADTLICGGIGAGAQEALKEEFPEARIRLLKICLIMNSLMTKMSCAAITVKTIIMKGTAGNTAAAVTNCRETGALSS